MRYGLAYSPFVGRHFLSQGSLFSNDSYLVSSGHKAIQHREPVSLAHVCHLDLMIAVEIGLCGRPLVVALLIDTGLVP